MKELSIESVMNTIIMANNHVLINTVNLSLDCRYSYCFNMNNNIFTIYILSLIYIRLF